MIKLRGLVEQPDIVYVEEYTPIGICIHVITPEDSFKIKSHYNGFGWGYPGEHGNQLALAICMEYTADVLALGIYKEFREKFLDSLPQDKDFELDEEQVKDWIFDKLISPEVKC